jgi:hypothetical protein
VAQDNSRRRCQAPREQASPLFAPLGIQLRTPVPANRGQVVDGNAGPLQAELDGLEGKDARGFLDTRETLFLDHGHDFAVAEKGGGRMMANIMLADRTIVDAQDKHIFTHGASLEE